MPHRSRSVLPIAALAALLVMGAAPLARAGGLDEPGLAGVLDEPGVTTTTTTTTLRRAPTTVVEDVPSLRFEIAFGLSSLLVDPDINQGIGGGFYLAWGLHSWIGVEATVFASHNTYKGDLGAVGTAFSGGNISLGPIFQLTRPGARFSATVDLGFGFYHIVPTVQQGIWTFGVSAGMTLGVRVTRWFGLGIKPRYHMHNLAHVSGPQLLDLKSLRKVGVVDRLEVPFYVAFYFL